jgi:hypothetical protein
LLKALGFCPCTHQVKTWVSKFAASKFNSYRYNELTNLKKITFKRLVKDLREDAKARSAAVRKKRKLEEVDSGDADDDGGGQLGSGGGDDEELATEEDVAEANMPDGPDADGSPLAAGPSSLDVCYHCDIPFDSSVIDTARHYLSCGHAIWCGECAKVGLCTRFIQLTLSSIARGFNPCAHNKVRKPGF